MRADLGWSFTLAGAMNAANAVGYLAGALTATGIAAGYLDVLAATKIYDWLPIVVGLGVAGLVAAAGLALAHRWRSEHLGLLVVVPLMTWTFAVSYFVERVVSAVSTCT